MRWWKLPAISAFAVVVLLSATPVFLARFGFHYLPSAEWVAQSHSGATVLGWATLVGATWLTLQGARKQDPDGLGFKWVLIIPFGAFMYYWMGYVSVTVGAPLAIQLVSGKPVALSYEIEDLDRRGDGKCRRPIKLKGLPFAFDELCGVQQAVREKLLPGEKITVTGQGTRFGLLPEKIAP